MDRLWIVALAMFVVACGGSTPEAGAGGGAETEAEAEAETEAETEAEAEAEAETESESEAESEAASEAESPSGLGVAPPSGSTAPTAGLSCEQMQAEYTRLTSLTSCSADADCHILEGQCAHGLGGCAFAVSTSVAQSALTDLGQAYRRESCGGGACRCASPPSAARCESGACVPG